MDAIYGGGSMKGSGSDVACAEHRGEKKHNGYRTTVEAQEGLKVGEGAHAKNRVIHGKARY